MVCAKCPSDPGVREGEGGFRGRWGNCRPTCCPYPWSESADEWWQVWAATWLLLHFHPPNLFFSKRFYLFTFRQRGREGERKGKKHQCGVVSYSPATGHLAYNPGMCPDWESNRQSFGLQAGTQSTESHQSGLTLQILPTNFLWSILTRNLQVRKFWEM